MTSVTAQASPRPTVYVVDDDVAVRDSLCLLCDTAGFESIAYDCAESFLERFQPDHYGCLVLDVRMGGMTGPELHAELSRRGSDLPIIYLTGHGDVPMSVRAMKAGAADFLLKPVDAAQLIDRIKAVLQLSHQAQAQQRAIVQMRQKFDGLSAREFEVMTLAIAGYSSKRIARQLGISHRTVEVHRSHLLDKTGTANVLELAQLAADCGIRTNSDSADER